MIDKCFTSAALSEYNFGYSLLCLWACLVPLALVLASPKTIAGSATWNLNPVSGDWNNPANWTPNTVPDGPDDVATFGISSITAISLPGFIKLHSLVIGPGASGFTFTTLAASLLTMSGTGIVNNSGIVQNFVTGDSESGFGAIQIEGTATAGTETVSPITGVR